MMKNWFPVKIVKNENNEFHMHWKFFNDQKFTHPFFDETVASVNSYPINSILFKVITDRTFLDLQIFKPSLAPDVFVFHTSRCGSTALCQAFAQSEQVRVFAEYPPMDDLLRLSYSPATGPSEKLTGDLRDLVSVMGQMRSGVERHLLIKLDSWHIHFAQILRNAFPETPFVFLYNDPRFIKASQFKLKGMHAVPGVLEPYLFDMKELKTDLDVYLDEVLTSYYVKILSFMENDDLSYALNYQGGMNHILDRIGEIINLEGAFEEKSKMHQQLSKDSKKPDEIFDKNNTNLMACSDECMSAYSKLTEYDKSKVN